MHYSHCSLFRNKAKVIVFILIHAPIALEIEHGVKMVDAWLNAVHIRCQIYYIYTYLKNTVSEVNTPFMLLRPCKAKIVNLKGHMNVLRNTKRSTVTQDGHNSVKLHHALSCVF